jgi:hypothetical protein
MTEVGTAYLIGSRSPKGGVPVIGTDTIVEDDAESPRFAEEEEEEYEDAQPL